MLPEFDGCGVTDLPWLSVSPHAARVPAGGEVTVTVRLDAAADGVAQPGDYRAVLAVASDSRHLVPAVPVTRTVEPGSVAARVTRLVTPVVIVIVVVLAAARGMRAPRRTMRAAWVGTQDWVVVVFVVTVLTDVVLTVTELWALTVVVFVLLGSREIVVLIIVDAPLGVTELVMVVVEPSLLVIVVGLGTAV